MKDLFEICGECRHLSDAEVVYQLTNNKETSNQVNAMLANGSNVSIEDICNLLTPARRDMALAVIELYKRIKERKNNYKRITSSADVYKVMLPYMADLKVEECWAIFLNQASRIIRKQRISVGGLAATFVDVRVILREALSCNATSIILCHNHPSGKLSRLSKRPVQSKRLSMKLSWPIYKLNCKKQKLKTKGLYPWLSKQSPGMFILYLISVHLVRTYLKSV